MMQMLTNPNRERGVDIHILHGHLERIYGTIPQYELEEDDVAATKDS